MMTSDGEADLRFPRGERRRQRWVTKAGNTHARRALVEGAWAYCYPAKVSRHLQLRTRPIVPRWPAARTGPVLASRVTLNSHAKRQLARQSGEADP
jgi:transposase